MDRDCTIDPVDHSLSIEDPPKVNLIVTCAGLSEVLIIGPPVSSLLDN